MRAQKNVTVTLEEVISEIAAILAQGYMRQRNVRRLIPEPDDRTMHMAQAEES